MLARRSTAVVSAILALACVAGLAGAADLDGIRDLALPGVDGVTYPRALPQSRVAPSYPPTAYPYGGGATIVVFAAVAADGRVAGVEVVSSDAPGLGFEEAAAGAVSRWRYRPAEKDGTPVASYAYVKLHFRAPDPAALADSGSLRTYMIPTDSTWSAAVPLDGLAGARVTTAAGQGLGTRSTTGRPSIFAAASNFPSLANGEMMDRRGYNPNPRDLSATPPESGTKTVYKNVGPRNGTGGR